VSVHRRNKLCSVGSVERFLGFLKTLKKEVFARVHHLRKHYSLILLEKLREESIEVLSEHKECTKDNVSSSYKIRKKRIEFPGGNP
jgi:hypothetical protein